MSSAEHPTVLATLREMNGTVRILVIGTLISNLATFLNAFLVLFLTDEGFTAWESGVVLTALMVGRISGSAVGGAVADRVGYRAVIVGSMAGTAVLTAALVHVPEVWTASVVAAGAGLTAQAYRPASMAWIVELTPKNQQVMVFSVLRLTFNVGATVGPMGAALLLTYASYGTLFYVDAATSLAFGVVAYAALRSNAEPEAAAKASDGKHGGYGQVLADRRFMLVVLGLFVTAVTYIQSSAALPLFVTGSGHDERVYATLLTVNGFIVIAFEVLLSKWLQRLPIGLPMTIGMAVLGIGHLLYTGPTPVALLLLATVVWTFGEVIAAPSMMAYPGLVAPPALRAHYIAAATIPQQVGYAVGPMIGVAAWHAWGAGVWVLTGALGLLGAGLVAAGADLRRRRPQDGPDEAELAPAGTKEGGD
ncbi:Predicted arabinose efflux permease, MFS family [Actinomadura meyerae]|uniref:Predicted arabinose efflux permease, MFS family n=1 Tax=Actinomadura meyerae TaxID=240840 RepID=A0A239KU25_9ACTN|nr:MFS transporter [Actinomadura meyerae]SNT20734.1 Predicted arabinose efflux permease, MFS family [Actinomadura meyerae]